ncbi:general odorant-binding protein 72 [Plodia interpunctella]|uniref:general odorant-binding protein 72 n=1 Tax=Plodia interpunctella TaxID=58824 RepID=UPI0023683F96|nr:general odorant-binding protein 72-like [Plodia interpunctella]XP_053608374.1 general odorant-binding protein 72-like [Plodia interpunctella]XP_053608375.1 general odorant-binding protein 72-like [Plodia interpunctella]
MEAKVICFLMIGVIIGTVNCMTRAQLKNSGKMFRKNCLAKVKVEEELIADIEKGKFIEDKDVMCYIACVYQMTQIVKNNKLSYEAAIKQIDLMYPADMKESVKKSVDKCKDISKKYKDLCEASFYTAKCIYEDNPKDFIFA